MIFELLLLVVVFLITSIPLHLAVRFLGGKTSLLNTMFINVIAGVIVAAIQFYFKVWGGLIAFLILLWIYREAFHLKWWKAIVAWLLQFVIIVLFAMLFSLFGLLIWLL